MLYICRDPNPLLEDGGVIWGHYTEEDRKYIRFTTSLDSSSSRSHFRAQQMALWNDYLPYLLQNSPCDEERSKFIVLMLTFHLHLRFGMQPTSPVLWDFLSFKLGESFWSCCFLTIYKCLSSKKPEGRPTQFLPPTSQGWGKVKFSVCSPPGGGGGGGGYLSQVPNPFPKLWSKVLSGGYPDFWSHILNGIVSRRNQGHRTRTFSRLCN